MRAFTVLQRFVTEIRRITNEVFYGRLQTNTGNTQICPLLSVKVYQCLLRKVFETSGSVRIYANKPGMLQTVSIDFESKIIDAVRFFLINGSDREFDFLNSHIVFHNSFPDIAEKNLFL